MSLESFGLKISLPLGDEVTTRYRTVPATKAKGSAFA
jgi:hypothetical protein